MPSFTARVAASAAVCVSFGQGANPHAALGSYQPVSDVVEHAQMVFDVEEFTNLVGAYAWDDAKAVYTSGMYSCKSPSETRKFQDFVEQGTVDSKLRGEAFFDTFTNGTGPSGVAAIPGSGRLQLADTFWDDFMLAALDGTGAFSSASNDFRKVAAAKGILGVLTMYTTHEMEAAIVKAGNGDTSDTQAAHAWDEAWAFYYGSHPDSAGKYSAWEFAWKRDRDYAYDVNGSRVNSATEVSTQILKYFNQGLRASRAGTLDIPVLVEARDNIYRLLALASIRAALKYAYYVFRDNTYSETYHIEAYAYFLAAAGWVEQAAPGVAAQVLDLLDYTKTEAQLNPDLYCAVKEALVPAYGPLGLDCDLVGVFKSLPANVAANCTVSCPSAAVLPAGLASFVGDTDTTAGSNKDCPAALHDENAVASAATAASGSRLTMLVAASVGVLAVIRPSP